MQMTLSLLQTPWKICLEMRVWKESMEEIQEAAACSFILQSLLQDSRSCVQLMVPECNASCK